MRPTPTCTHFFYVDEVSYEPNNQIIVVSQARAHALVDDPAARARQLGLWIYIDHSYSIHERERN